ncbi:hypothetical protein CR513_53159, partial [Mucuna pruriens]
MLKSVVLFLDLPSNTGGSFQPAEGIASQFSCFFEEIEYILSLGDKDTLFGICNLNPKEAKQRISQPTKVESRPRRSRLGQTDSLSDWLTL